MGSNTAVAIRAAEEPLGKLQVRASVCEPSPRDSPNPCGWSLEMINATLRVWLLHTFAALLGIRAKLVPVVLMAVVLLVGYTVP